MRELPLVSDTSSREVPDTIRFPAEGGSRSWHITFYAPPWVWNSPGGGEVQLEKTAEHLTRIGLRVRTGLSDHELESDCRGGLRFETDWLHLFGTWPECLAMARRAKARGVSIAISPITWYDPWVNWKLLPTIVEKVRGVAGWTARRICSRVPSWRRDLLQLADLLLPNSRSEASQLRQLFGIEANRIVVVPNGVDSRFERGDANLFKSRFEVSDFVLVPGRIEPRKNQLAVLLALWGSGIPVVVLGDAHPDHLGYFEECRRVADPGVTFVSRLGHDSPLLAAAYAAARVVVLASWFETPGLAALEGALAGAHIVVTNRGSAREYFGEMASYVRPNDLGAIRSAVRHAFKSPPNVALKEHVRRSFLWENVARETAAAYQRFATTRLTSWDGTFPPAVAA